MKKRRWSTNREKLVKLTSLPRGNLRLPRIMSSSRKSEPVRISSNRFLGAFSKVYKARHKLSKALRCVKKLSKKDLTDEDKAKLVEEVLILKNLVRFKLIWLLFGPSGRSFSTFFQLFWSES